MAERRYSDGEAASILQTAAEMSHQGGSEQGVTLDELQRVAQELGLDPEKVRLAVERADRVKVLDGGQSDFIGAPPQYELDRLLDRELSEEAWVAAVAEMERVYGEGKCKGTHSTRTWHRETFYGWVNLTASQRDGRTVLRFGTHIDKGIFLAMLGMSAMAFAVGAAVFGNIPMPGWAIVLLAIGLVAAAASSFRFFTKEWLRADKAKANAALDRAVTVVQSNAPMNVAGVQLASSSTEVHQQDLLA